MVLSTNSTQAAVQYADSGHSGQVDYVDDAQIYEDDHGGEQNQQQQQQQYGQQHYDDDYGYEGADAYDQGGKDYYQYHNNDDHRRHDGREDMW